MWNYPVVILRSAVERASGAAAAFVEATRVHTHGLLGTTWRQIAQFAAGGATWYAWLEPIPGVDEARILLVEASQGVASAADAVRLRLGLATIS